METAKKFGGRIIPVDSEHSALFQCLASHDKKDLKSLVLTCSGGPFRGFSTEKLAGVSAAEALKHPVWSMGRKITVDSASLMNKALEVAEAAFLFGCNEKDIKVIIHPEGIVHSLVEFNDNSMIGLFSNPSMELPIQYALTYPDVITSKVEALDLAKIASLHFEQVDNEVFPSIEIARNALRIGKNMPLVMNAANDVAVMNFLEGRIKFTQIWNVITETMGKIDVAELNSLEDIISADSAARCIADETVKKIQ
jgi:1-deoxy-D-xylulose-5-phosphate reductoisomerase